MSGKMDIKKPSSKKQHSLLFFETVIKSYYRGATQIDKSSTFSCTNIHSWLVTGSVPVSAYSPDTNFGLPSEGHSIIRFIQASTITCSLECCRIIYSSSSSVLLFYTLPYETVSVNHFLTFLRINQFLKLWIGAGIRPPLSTNASQENWLTGMIGA